MSRTTFYTTTILPPAPEITPDQAARWMHKSYPVLSDFAAMGAYPFGLCGRKRDRELAGMGLRSIMLDVQQIASACGEAIATGHPVRVGMRSRDASDPNRALLLRAVLRYEARCPHRGVRGVLRRALRERAA